MKVLLVITSHDTLGSSGKKSGYWLEEVAAPYYKFKDAGVELVLASPRSCTTTNTAPAIISVAALLNALVLVCKRIEQMRMVVNGAGAAAVSCLRLCGARTWSWWIQRALSA